MGSLLILDTTLRDGEQQPGVAFSWNDKVKIASYLNDLGVPEVELGTPSMGLKEKEDITRLANAGFNFQSVVWSRAKNEDIISASQTGAQRIHISLPISDIHLNAMEKSREWLKKVARESIDCATYLFENVSIGFQDASRCDNNFLDEMTEFILDQGIKRIRYADTVGSFTPNETESVFKQLHRDFPQVEWEFHGHNDYGLANANALASVLGGATCVNVTLGGIGERAGNTALEEFVLLIQNKFYDLPYIDSTKFCEIENILRQNAGLEMSHNKPIIGKNCFVHKTGIHQNLLLKDPSAYQSIFAEQIGNKQMKFLFDKHSGSRAVEFFLKEKGISFTLEELNSFITYMKTFCGDKKVSWTGDQMNKAFIHWRNEIFIEVK